MNLAEQMKARLTNGHAQDGTEHQFEMPSLPERPAELSDLAARRAQLGRDRKAIETELRQIEEKRWQEQQNDVDSLDQAAERIASGETEVTALNAIPEAVETLRLRLDLAQRAESKLVKQIVEGNARQNRAIAKALRPQHRRAVQRIHAALLELEAANAQEVAVRSAVPGVPLESFAFPGIGTRGPNGGGQLRYWISYARRFGMLAEEDARTISEAAD